MLSKILVAVDGSPNAEESFEYASSLAQKYVSKLLIVHILEQPSTIGYSISKELEKDSRQMLEKYQSKAKMLSLKSVNIIQARGNSVAQEILQISDDENVDTIVVGRRGRYISSNNEILLGSTSYMLTHYAKCTVITVK
jgi:nucleotide-binding universal stress UspA family protein